MSLSVLFPMLAASASTGLTCGVSCGACGTPVVNVFFSSYLLTHSGKLRRSLLSFSGFHLGKMASVTLLCVLISLLGSQIVDASGRVFGVNLQLLVYAAMLVFMAVLIVRWFHSYGSAAAGEECDGCCGGCTQEARKQGGFLPMLLYGCISGFSPCASLLLVLGYASALSAAEAAMVGLCFALANSLLPLLLLVTLTGLLSGEMHREISRKIKYFQLATYLVFTAAIAYNMMTS